MLENCTNYIEDYWDEPCTPCKCPVCGGWIRWDDNGEPICNKCGAELIKVPEVDEETSQTLDSGKICALSGRKKTVEQAIEQKRINRLVKQEAKKWKGWL